MLYSRILNFNWTSSTICVNRVCYTTEKFIFLALEHKTQKSLADYLKCSVSTVKLNISKYLPELGTSSRKPLEHKIYEILDVKYCSKCDTVKDKKDFYSTNHYCKNCHKSYYNENRENILVKEAQRYNNSAVRLRKKEYNKNYASNNKEKFRLKSANRRASIIDRTPKWADLDLIEEIYLNCPKGYEVDHIIPLNGVNVSGLHVPNNLQYLTPEENRQKSNKYDNSTKTKME